MLTWLADVLRAEGLTVNEFPGWKTRGRPGPFAPKGWILHHDASAKGLSLYEPKFLAVTGRPAEGIPAPLAQTWVAKDGQWWVLAAGRCNHAGAGAGWGAIRAGQGNADSGGTEWDHTVGEGVTDVEWDSLTRGFAAITRRLGVDPADAVCGHREYAPGRKIDPTDVNLDTFRRRVKALQQGDDMALTDADIQKIALEVWRYDQGGAKPQAWGLLQAAAADQTPAVAAAAKKLLPLNGAPTTAQLTTALRAVFASLGGA